MRPEEQSCVSGILGVSIVARTPGFVPASYSRERVLYIANNDCHDSQVLGATWLVGTEYVYYHPFRRFVLFRLALPGHALTRAAATKRRLPNSTADIVQLPVCRYRLQVGASRLAKSVRPALTSRGTMTDASPIATGRRFGPYRRTFDEMGVPLNSEPWVKEIR